MKTAWLRKEGSRELLLFFSGWGMDQRIASHLLVESIPSGFDGDLLAFHDYRTLELEPSLCLELARYGRTTLIAWSFGVWAAAQAGIEHVDRALAVNGTLHPVHARFGIAPELFQATLATYSEEQRPRFNRRMCGTREALDLLSSIAPLRSALDQQEELRELDAALCLRKAKAPKKNWQYTHALIGGRDNIFPAGQQFAAWRGVPQTVISDMPHFPFCHFANFQELLACISL
ncbi:MAG: pimeloyl-ACP methyl esterase BioG family protein [Chlorobiaceae bacterium]